jgi:transposase
MEAIAVIPPKSNRKEQREYDKHYYKERNLIERFFGKLTPFRGIATRYCKRGKYFLEAVKLASVDLVDYARSRSLIHPTFEQIDHNLNDERP